MCERKDFLLVSFSRRVPGQVHGSARVYVVRARVHVYLTSFIFHLSSHFPPWIKCEAHKKVNPVHQRRERSSLFICRTKSSDEKKNAWPNSGNIVCKSLLDFAVRFMSSCNRPWLARFIQREIRFLVAYQII